MNPVSWWHDLQGGEIAKQRPPPPGATEPYPNFAALPAKPTPPDQKTLDSITQDLVADRAHADYLAAATPLPDPSSPTASPALFGQGTMPPPPPPGTTPVASATMPAASAPPLPPAAAQASNKEPANGEAPPPLPAPLRPVHSTPLAPPPTANQAATAATQHPTAAAVPSQSAGPGTATPNSASKVAANAPLAPPGSASAPPGSAATMSAATATPPVTPAPAIPAQPPAPPKITGPGAPAVAPMAVASASPPAPPLPANATTVEFVTGSATLPLGAGDVLKEIVAKRGHAVIAVTGYGDATSDDPAAQSAALTLGMSRAQAVEAALTSDGVPANDVRVGAEAAGRGASIRLVQ